MMVSHSTRRPFDTPARGVIATCFSKSGTASGAALFPSVVFMRAAAPAQWRFPVHLVVLVMVPILFAGLVCFSLRRAQAARHQAILRERERMALNIHDTLAQSFAGIAFQLEAVRSMFAEADPIRSEIDLILEMVRRGHSEAKRSLIDVPRGKNIAESLRQYAERSSSRRMLEIRSSYDGQTRELPGHVADTIYLIGQEAIANSLRHSGASQIHIGMHFDRGTATLAIRDNGRGFNVDANSCGLGFQGMLQRAASISAQLHVSSTPGNGTTIELTAPTSGMSVPARHGGSWLKQFLRHEAQIYGKPRIAAENSHPDR